MSPTHDEYRSKKPTLISSKHRLAMVKRSVAGNSLVKSSGWETEQEGWTRTVHVLRHHGQEIASAAAGDSNSSHYPHLPDNIPQQSGSQQHPRLMLICGGDMLESFSVPNLWDDDHILSIVRDFGLVVFTREGSNPAQYVDGHKILQEHRDNIHIVTTFANDISSTKVRNAVRAGESIKTLVTDQVEAYIRENKLYCETDE